MEGFAMFEHMIESIEDEVAKFVMKAEIENNLEREEVVQGQTTGSSAARRRRQQKSKESTGSQSG